MAAYARARTRSWLSRIWFGVPKDTHNESSRVEHLSEIEEKHNEQKRRFIEAARNGGVWFS